MTSPLIFHICARADWDAAVARGAYEHPSLATEGFIHCSYAHQLTRVANRFFAGGEDLVALGIERRLLTAPVRIEDADGEAFPHVYGPIDVDAVFDVTPLTREADGTLIADEAQYFELFASRTLEEAAGLAREAMDGFPHPWWIAGGWAIDLFLGEKTRPHADLEICILRDGVPALHEQMRGRDLRAVHGQGDIRPWYGEPLPDPWHQIWTRAGTEPAETWQEFARDPTMIDVLVDEGDATRWRSRRHGSLTLPVEEVGLMTADGTPYVRPEIQLLYKAKYVRWKDERDFTRALPRLDERARAWLRDGLALCYGDDHPWRARL